MSLGNDFNSYSCQDWADMGASYPIADDRNTAVWSEFGSGIVPLNVMIDTSGVVRYSEYGHNERSISAALDDLLSSIVIDEEKLPETLMLLSNYPNPFNAGTELSYSLNVESDVVLLILNARGEVVINLIQEKMKAGEYSVFWEGLDNRGLRLPSGIYIAQLRTPEAHLSQKLLLLK